MYVKKIKKEKKKRKLKPELITVIMEVKLEKPPDHIYKRAKEVFGTDVIDFERGTIFAYGKYIHAAKPIDRDFFIHESVHGNAQILYNVGEKSSNKESSGPDAWWDRYFTDVKFRYDEEVKAYKAQYRFLKTIVKDRNAQNRYLMTYAEDLSGPMYGNMVGFSEASKLIKNL